MIWSTSVWLSLAALCACSSPGAHVERTYLSQLERVFGRRADEQREFDSGLALHIWNFHQDWSELEPADTAYVAVARRFEVLGTEYLPKHQIDSWSAAELEAFALDLVRDRAGRSASRAGN